MASVRRWLRLPLPSSVEVPVLLVSMDIGTAAYTIHVTDMANIWTEGLDRKAICMRGWSENTVIDPSDTAENMAKFLTYLTTALDPTQPGHDETHLSIAPASRSDAGEGGLTLKITCKITGLPPLKWPIHLKKSPSSAVATDLVLPLIEAHLIKSREIEALVQMLGQKDAIITKLIDKLDAVGTGLEHVFNALSGRKKVSRSVAEDKVLGLAPFNRQRWKSTLADREDGPSNTEALVKEVFAGQGLGCQSLMEIDESPGLDSWWLDFSATSHRPSRSQDKTVPLRTNTTSQPEPPKDIDIDADNDDFQIQATPPHLKTGTQQSTGTSTIPDDASTEDEEGSPPPKPHQSPVKDNQKSDTKRPLGRLGGIGHKKSDIARSPSPVQASSLEKTSGMPADDSETASETEDDGAPASPPDEEPAPPISTLSKPVPKKGGLGRIGGPKTKSAVQEKASITEADATHTSPQSKPRKLGVIGKKTGQSEAQPGKEEDRGRPHVASNKDDVKESRPRETSKERADRKRQELKRELEKKAAAGPAKKKRKF